MFIFFCFRPFFCKFFQKNHLAFSCSLINLLEFYSQRLKASGFPCLLIKRLSCHHIETDQLICFANQLTGFYMIATLAFNELVHFMPLVSFYNPWKHQKTKGYFSPCFTNPNNVIFLTSLSSIVQSPDNIILFKWEYIQIVYYVLWVTGGWNVVTKHTKKQGWVGFYSL